MKYADYYKHLIYESLADSYPYKGNFTYEKIEEEDEESGELYIKEVFSPTQIIRFKTDDNIEYIWYAKQSRHNNHYWTIAFGVYKGLNDRGAHELNIELTKNTKNPLRVFATIISITNRFIELDENYEIQYLGMESIGDKRTKLYLNRIIPKIENFELDYVQTGETSNITLKRIS